MPTVKKIYAELMSKNMDNNLRFAEIQKLLKYFEFVETCKGDHFIYRKQGISGIINIQPNGNKMKQYQVKQIRDMLLDNNMEV